MYDIRNLTIWKQETGKQPSKQYLNSDISELNLSVRSYNCLRRAGCRTVGDILSIIEGDEKGLRKIRNLGSRSEAEILECVQQYKDEYREGERREGDGREGQRREEQGGEGQGRKGQRRGPVMTTAGALTGIDAGTDASAPFLKRG